MRRTGPLMTALAVWTLILLSFGWSAQVVIALLTGVDMYPAAIFIWLGGVILITLLARLGWLPSNPPGDTCPHCRYDCAAIPSRPNDTKVCPECGRVIN